MADRPMEELGGKTPLEVACTPNMDRMAEDGVVGLARTIPEGMALGSDVANLSVLGYDPAAVYTGRSPLEAAGMGVDLGPDDVAFRCNLVTLGLPGEDGPDTALPHGDVDPRWIMVDFAGGHPNGSEAASILETLTENLAGNGIEFHPGVSYRHLVVWRNGLDSLEIAPPHDLTDQPVGAGWPQGEAADGTGARVARGDARAQPRVERERPAHPAPVAGGNGRQCDPGDFLRLLPARELHYRAAAADVDGSGFAVHANPRRARYRDGADLLAPGFPPDEHAAFAAAGDETGPVLQFQKDRVQFHLKTCGS